MGNSKSLVPLRDITFCLDFGDAKDLLDFARRKPYQCIHFCSASTVVHASQNIDFAKILSLNTSIIDSTPLSLLLTGDRRSLIRGTDFVRELISRCAGSETIFLIGSTNKVLERFISNAQKLNPDINIVGSHSPSFSDSVESKIETATVCLENLRPSFILVALSSPQQDYFIDAMSKIVPSSYFAVGAAFDFIAGTKAEAPKWIQRSGFEWLFRLIKEPKRLWKRYLVDNYLFLKLALLHLSQN